MDQVIPEIQPIDAPEGAVEGGEVQDARLRGAREMDGILPAERVLRDVASRDGAY